ncbi:MAG: hypothetical protein DRJ01_11320 [Bacteroidetes bacterium]|nr:MAG: hypothetical protein DRJ01_11320 [Bacteroidota bacterium]
MYLFISIFADKYIKMKSTENIKLYGWKNSYNTGIIAIDEQNKKFIDIINKLTSSINGDCTNEIFSDVFFSLIHYVEESFTKEKIYFKDYNTEKFTAIQNSHDELFERIIHFQKIYEQAGKTNSCVNIVDFLINWFENHMKIFDNQAIGFLKNKGLE